MLPKAYRARGVRIKKFNKPSHRVSSQNISASVILKEGAEHGTYTFIIPSSQIKQSVKRNILRRRAREIVRKNLPCLKTKNHIILHLRAGALTLSFQDLERELTLLLQKAER